MIVPAFDLLPGELATFPFEVVKRAEFDAYAGQLLSRAHAKGRILQLYMRIEPSVRSRNVESYHWFVQLPLWREHMTLLTDKEAHEDLLARFPVWGQTPDGRRYRKRSRDMEADEYLKWVCEDIIIGCALLDCQIPYPNEAVVV